VFAKSTIFTLSRFSLLPEISASSVLFRYSHSSPRYPRPHSSPRYPHPRSSVRVIVLVHIHILGPRSSILARSTIFTLPRFSLLPEISASSSSVLVQVLDPRQVHNLTLSLPHPHSDHHQVHKLRSSAILTPRRDILVLILGPLPLSASSVLNPRPHPRPRSTPKSLSASSSTSSVLGPQSASSSTPASSVLGPQSASSSSSEIHTEVLFHILIAPTCLYGSRSTKPFRMHLQIKFTNLSKNHSLMHAKDETRHCSSQRNFPKDECSGVVSKTRRFRSVGEDGSPRHCWQVT